MSDVPTQDAATLVYVPALESAADRLERLLDDIPCVLPEAMGDDAFRKEIHQVLTWLSAGTLDVCRRLRESRDRYTTGADEPSGGNVAGIWARPAPPRPDVFASLAEQLPNEDPYETAHLGEMLHQLGRFIASYASTIAAELPTLADRWTDDGCSACLASIRRFVRGIESAAAEVDGLGLRCRAMSRQPRKADRSRRRAA